MTETTHQIDAKTQQMTAIQKMITGTGMATAKLWNAYPRIVEQGIDLRSIEAPATSTSVTVTEVLPDGQPFDRISKKRLIAAKYALSLPGFVTAENVADVRQRLRHRYVNTGAVNYIRLPSGNCTLFACCVIGMLAANPGLGGNPGPRVELFNVFDGVSDSHNFVVVGRTGTDLDDLASYGPGCFFIDQWYARHRATKPGTQGVKDPASNGTFSDQAFFDFIFSYTYKTSVLSFTWDELAPLATDPGK